MTRRDPGAFDEPRPEPPTPEERYGRTPCPVCGSTGPHGVHAFFGGARITCRARGHVWEVIDPPPRPAAG